MKFGKLEIQFGRYFFFQTYGKTTILGLRFLPVILIWHHEGRGEPRTKEEQSGR